MHLQKGLQLPTLAKMLNFWFQNNVGIHTGSPSHHHANTKDALETGPPSLCSHPWWVRGPSGVCTCLASNWVEDQLPEYVQMSGASFPTKENNKGKKQVVQFLFKQQ